jgi:hypothetical protein
MASSSPVRRRQTNRSSPTERTPDPSDAIPSGSCCTRPPRFQTPDNERPLDRSPVEPTDLGREGEAQAQDAEPVRADVSERSPTGDTELRACQPVNCGFIEPAATSATPWTNRSSTPLVLGAFAAKGRGRLAFD